MPLARVICRSDQEAAPLIERLQTLGYTVEAVAPGETGTQLADLEIELEGCSLEEALAQADSFARSHADAQIFIAPGVLPAAEESEGAARPNALYRAIATISDGIRETQLHISKAWHEAFDRALHRQAEYEREIAAPPEPPQRELPPVPLTEPTLQSSAAQDRVHYQLMVRHAEEEHLRAAELERQAEEQRERERQQIAREAEVQRRNQEAEAEVLRMAEEAARWDLLASETALQPEVQAGAEVQAEPEEAVTGQSVPQHAELEPVTAAHLQPEPTTTAPEPPLKPPVVPISQPTPARMPVVAAPPSLLPRAVHGRGVPRRVREWRLAMITAAGVAVLLMGAWSLVTSPRPAAPLTPEQLMHSSSVEEQVPFGPTTVRNKPVKATAPVRIRIRPTQTPAKPVAATRQNPPVARRNAPAAARTHSRSAQRRPVRRGYTADDLEDEVVIHHYSPARMPQPNNAQANIGTKRFSDTN